MGFSFRNVKPEMCDGLFTWSRVATATAACVVAIETWYGLQKYRRERLWTKRVEEKRNACSSSKARLQDHLNDVQSSESINRNIVKLPFAELQQCLQEGKLDAVQVIRAYQQKALEVDKELNCIIEPISEAEDWARSSSKGPLHGIPISIKDTTPVQGYGLTLGGCVNLLGFTHPADAAFIQVLKKQGAVPFAITNAPQTLLSFACVNPVFGFTGNPHNRDRTPGGSSGGEGALIGGYGSILGIGNDLGGSVRVPAAFCGICALKPTHQRFSYLGYSPIMQTVVAPTTGPMGRDVDAIVAFMKALLVPDLWQMDPTMAPLPFRDEIYKDSKPLRIGFYKDDGLMPAIPAYHRAIDMVKDVLEKQGHTLVPFQIPDLEYAVNAIGLGACFADGGQMIKQLLTGDKLSHDLIFPLWTLWLPMWLRRIYCWLDSFRDKMRAKALLSTCKNNSVPDWWMLTGSAQGYRTRFIELWKSQKLDAVICPPCASVAMPDGVATRIGVFYSYTFLYNIVNFPAGVVPVTQVSREDVERLSRYSEACDSHRVLKKAMEGSEGLPVGVQCVGLPFQEETVLRLMKLVEEGLKARK